MLALSFLICCSIPTFRIFSFKVSNPKWLLGCWWNLFWFLWAETIGIVVRRLVRLLSAFYVVGCFSGRPSSVSIYVFLIKLTASYLAELLCVVNLRLPALFGNANYSNFSRLWDWFCVNLSLFDCIWFIPSFWCGICFLKISIFANCL